MTYEKLSKANDLRDEIDRLTVLVNCLGDLENYTVICLLYPVGVTSYNRATQLPEGIREVVINVYCEQLKVLRCEFEDL